MAVVEEGCEEGARSGAPMSEYVRGFSARFTVGLAFCLGADMVAEEVGRLAAAHQLMRKVFCWGCGNIK